jgi:hypothetical protein
VSVAVSELPWALPVELLEIMKIHSSWQGLAGAEVTKLD